MDMNSMSQKRAAKDFADDLLLSAEKKRAALTARFHFINFIQRPRSPCVTHAVDFSMSPSLFFVPAHHWPTTPG